MSGSATRGALARPIAEATVVFALAAGLGVFHVWSRTRAVCAGYRLAAVQQEHGRLSSENDRLVLEVESLRNPRVLEAFARDRLDMAPPDPGPVWAGGAVGGGDHLPGPAEPVHYESQSVLAVRPSRSPSMEAR